VDLVVTVNDTTLNNNFIICNNNVVYISLMPPVKELDLPPDKLDELADELIDKLKMVLTARQNQVDDKAANWQKNYDALPAQKVRTVPFYRASNFMPHLIRMHSDILGARILGILFGTKPFWMVSSLLKNDIQHETLEALSAGLNYLWDTDLFGFEVVDDVVNHSLQTGTLTLKAIWSDTTSSYMDRQEFKEVTQSGMQYEPIPFEDFWPFPLTATSVQKAEILFHRIRLTENDVRDRRKSGRWNDTAAGFMLEDHSIDPIKEAQQQSTGINLTADVDYPYSAVECWLNYEIGGKRRPIVVVVNPLVKGRDAILRSYYNFMPMGEQPFIDFRPFRRRGSYFGYSVPEILEQSQEEVAQIHNARRDANTIANVPSFKKKRYADVPNPATDWYPGVVIELDDMDDLEPIVVPGNYNAMIDEEQFAMSLAERYIGISPSMQGFGQGQAAGKRGIYATGATLALLSEGNRRQDIFIRRLRYPFHRIGRLTALSYNAFAPDYFDKFGAFGQKVKDAFQLVDEKQGTLLYTPTASDATSNRETDRQALLQMAGTMGQYYTQIIQLTQMVSAMPPNSPMLPVSLMVLDGARDLVSRILFAFDIGDRDRILPDIAKVLGGGAGQAQPNQPGGMQPTPGNVQPSELQNVLARIAAVSGGTGG